MKMNIQRALMRQKYLLLLSSCSFLSRLNVTLYYGSSFTWQQPPRNAKRNHVPIASRLLPAEVTRLLPMELPIHISSTPNEDESHTATISTTTSVSSGMDLERSGAAVPARLSPTVPIRDKRKKKHADRKKGQKQQKKYPSDSNGKIANDSRGTKKSNAISVVTEEELVNHVSTMHNGEEDEQSGSVVKRRRSNSAKLAAKSVAAAAATANSNCIDHLQYLRQLDSLPALVLNANYQVRLRRPFSFSFPPASGNG